MIYAPQVDNKDLWGTPMPLFTKLDEKFIFSLDPCCTVEAAKCSLYYTPAENGLIQSWSGQSVFVNPPYSRGNIDKWVEKCFAESKHALVVALLPVSTSADWWHKYCIDQTKYWVNKRIRFEGARWTAPFSSVIIHFNHIDQSFSFNQ